MNLKLFELRDRATFIPIFAFRCRPGREATRPTLAERYLLRRAGFDPDDQDDHVIIGRLECDSPNISQCTYDVHAHNSAARTFLQAHHYIEAHWDELESGAVIDVEFILGETKEAKQSESVTHPEV